MTALAPDAMFLGLDFGTSGARACVIAPGGQIEDMARVEFGNLPEHEMAATWREGLFSLITQIPVGMRRRLQALAIDGTSATLLACDEAFDVLHPPLPYHDARAAAEVPAIARAGGDRHPAATATSSLAKALWLKRHLGTGRAHLFLHQADWLTALLSGRAACDSHNGLKLGLDPVSNAWPEWVAWLADIDTLPTPVRPGAALGLLERPRARELGVNSDCLVRAGTTDSIAAFLAAGVREPGQAVTSLGSTLVLKLVSRRRVDATEFGVYSHWFGDLWLAGGASNAGGAVLRQHFTDAEMRQLSTEIDLSRDSGLDYYPLPRPGERFPINDPALSPRLEPRPASRATFLHGVLEGLARIEARGYRLLTELGAEEPSNVTSCGGGARNPAFTRLRERLLGVPVSAAQEQEACYGAALLARDGVDLFPGGGDD